MKYFIMSFFSIITFFACKKNKENEKIFGSSINSQLSINQCKSILDSDVTISICFDSVLNDSRCPSLVNCFWAGIDESRFKVSINNIQHTIKLSVNGVVTPNFRLQNDTTISGYNFLIESLNPYPMKLNDIIYSEYKAKVKITKL